MSKVSDAEFRSFAEQFKSKLDLRLLEWNRKNPEQSVVVEAISIETAAEVKSVVLVLVSKMGRFGYRINDDEIGGQSTGDMSRAAYLCWLDIESGLIGLRYEAESGKPDADGVIWLMDD